MTETDIKQNDDNMEDGAVARGSDRLPALASRIYAEHNTALAAATCATEHAIKCGALLIEAKAGLEHGRWLPWIQANCPFSERTAQAYMRLAERVSRLDKQEAQRVADLPVRDAVKAVADSRDDNSMPLLTDSRRRDEQSLEECWEDAWAWAGRQVNGPVNNFDLQHWKLLATKLMKQLHVPVWAAVALDLDTDEECKLPPYLPLIPEADLLEAVKCLAPVAKGEFRTLDICFEDISQSLIKTDVYLRRWAVRLLGGFLNELHRRGFRLQ